MRQWLNGTFTAIALTAAALGAPALAQDAATAAQETPAQAPAAEAAPANKNTEKHVLRLDDCEFQITFPGEPYTARRCNPENPDQCNKIYSYTKVFGTSGLDATVNYNVSCNPSDPGMYDRYSGPVMKGTLEAMVGKNNLEEFQSDYSQTDDYKRAIIVGSGKIASSDRIYSAQLWIGKKSVFTIEGEIIGYGGQDADIMFADIMASAIDNKTADGGTEPAKGGEDGEPAAETPANETPEKTEKAKEKPAE